MIEEILVIPEFVILLFLLYKLNKIESTCRGFAERLYRLNGFHK